MVYEVPASKASIKQNRFEFKVPGDRKVYSVPLLRYVKPDLMVTVEESNVGNLPGMKMVLEEYAPGVFAKFDDGEQLDALFEAWQKASGISLGESEDSTAS